MRGCSSAAWTWGSIPQYPARSLLTPSAAMRDALARDYAAMSGMIFGEIPALDAVLASAERFEQIVNDATTAASLAHEERRE